MPSVLDYTKITGDHWKTIQQWRVDEGKTFAKSKSSAVARMAAGGMKEGSQQWQDNIAKIESKHAAESKSQSGSATQGILDRWTAQMKDFYVEATKTLTRNRPTKGEQDRMVTTPTLQATELNKSGQANPFVDSGLSEAEFRGLNTDDFMTLQYGKTEDYIAKQTGDAKMQEAEDERRRTSASPGGTTSPWWA